MKPDLEPGKYVVAVSGGVDSVVLLDVLARNKKLELSIAHFDHGIREDAAQDRYFVEALAKKYGLPFYFAEGKLGSAASEATARAARYEFLQKIRNLIEADAIVIAHHQDDVIETAFINLLRGSGRKGLTSLGSTKDIRRPLLDVTKAQLVDYAREHSLAWHEDSTNQDERYLRNYLRAQVLPALSQAGRKQLLEILQSAKTNNRAIDELLEQLLPSGVQDNLRRAWFIDLPHTVAREVLSSWLRGNGIAFDRTAIERLAVGLKTLPACAQLDISGGWYFQLDKDNIRLRRQSSV